MIFILVVFGLALLSLIGAVSSAIGLATNGLQILDAIKALPDQKAKRKFLKRFAVVTTVLTVMFVLVGLPSLLAMFPKANPSLPPDSATSLSVIDCGKPIESKPPDEGGPLYTQLHIVVQRGCVGILSANKGDIDNGLRHWGQDVGSLVAFPAGEHYIIFTDGELGFSPAAIANDKFCQIYTDSQGAGVHLRYVKPSAGWHHC